MINIVLFGPPGAGKGTQAKMLSEKYGFNHISTGEVIRNEIQRGTELGLQVKEVIESGRLASDELVIGIIEEYLASHGDSKGNIFDGFPRTTHQAETFDVIMEKRSDKVDVIRTRIDVYKAQTAVVADHYARQGKYIPINGLGTIEEVFARLCEVIDRVVAKEVR